VIENFWDSTPQFSIVWV